eukprot:XP_001709494.1 Hypothetical protein GL50803_38794 [Giardia lamblia ATCC 50803]
MTACCGTIGDLLHAAPLYYTMEHAKRASNLPQRQGNTSLLRSCSKFVCGAACAYRLKYRPPQSRL